MLRKRYLALLIALVTIVAAFMSACGTQQPPQATTAAAATEAATTAAAAATEAATTAAAATEAATTTTTAATKAGEEGMVVADTAVESAEATVVEGMTYNESPWFTGKNFPPVDDRLPKNPKIWNGIPEKHMKFEVGKYGGTLNTIRMSPTWDAIMWTASAERLINSPGRLAEEFTPNLVESYSISDDLTVFTFTLREGLKWSDGQPVTTEDVEFSFNYFICNELIHPVTPNLFKSGGSATGNVATLTIIDEYSWSYTFDAPYGGLVLRIAFEDYHNFLMPKHYLKDFHIDLADEDELKKKVEDGGYIWPEEWTTFFGFNRVNAWDTGRTSQMIGSTPTLAPWVHAVDGDMRVYHRNPYYWKIDSEGNQLPYIDEINSHYVTDISAAAIRLLAGDIDHGYEWVPLNQVPLFAENAASGGYTLSTNTTLHRTDADIFINQTYDDAVWQSVAQDVRFRQALNKAINRAEILEAVYFGFAKISDMQDNVYDLEGAKALLDEMGMAVGSDGFRTAPDGSSLVIDFAYSDWMAQYVPTAQIASESFRELGLNINLRMVDNSLMDQLRDANELQLCIAFQHGPVTAMFDDWGVGRVARRWEQFWNTNGAEGESPSPEFEEFIRTYFSIRQIHPNQIPAARTELRRMQNENLFSIIPVEDVTMVTLKNNELRNVPEAGFMISGCFAADGWWFDR